MIMRIPDFSPDEPADKPEETPHIHYMTTEQEIVNFFLSISDEDEAFIKKQVKKLFKKPKPEPQIPSREETQGWVKP